MAAAASQPVEQMPEILEVHPLYASPENGNTCVNNKNQKLDQDYYICISYYYFIVKNVEELVWSKITVDSCEPALFS
jgi:hypothetical protein